MAFNERLKRAIEKEEADAATLQQKYKCVVSPFGQAQLPDYVRHYLKAKPVYIRWLPDQIAIRPALFMAGIAEFMWLVDSKYSRMPNPYDYWLLEKSAHEAHRLQRSALGLPIVYIWPDGETCSYVEDLPDELLIPGPPHQGIGSGTPYWWVKKTLTRPLDEVFGKNVPNLADPFEDDIAV